MSLKTKLISATNSSLVNDLSVHPLFKTAGGGSPPAPSLTTLLLLHGDATDGSTVFIDASANDFSFTAAGNAQIDTAVRQVGDAALLFDGNGDSMSAAYPTIAGFDHTTDDFTIDFWFRGNSARTHSLFYLHTGTNACITMSVNSSWQLIATAWGESTSKTIFTAASSLTISTWHHLAYERYDGNLRLYVDGVLLKTEAFTDTLRDYKDNIKLGIHPNGSAHTHGSMDELRFSNTARYQGNDFAPPLSPYVGRDTLELLLHTRGENNSTTFVDSSLNQRTPTVYGNTSIDTDGYFNGYSAVFDGDGDRITYDITDLSLVPKQAFTIDFWAKATQVNDPFFVIGQDIDGDVNLMALRLMPRSGNTMRLYIRSSLSGAPVGQTQVDGVFTLGSWNHVAVCYDPDTDYLYIYTNGVLGGSYNFANREFDSAEDDVLSIGGYAQVLAFTSLYGWIDEFRFVVGDCLYPGGTTFTPNTIPYHDPSQPLLLLHGDGEDGSTTITDDSIYNTTITPIGNTQIDTGLSKFGGSAIIFDGTGDYATAPVDPSVFDFTTQDFTFECWINFAATPAGAATFLTTCDEPVTGYTIRFLAQEGTGFQFILYENDGTLRIATYALASLPTSTWMHVAGERHGNTVNVYYNGTKGGTTATVTKSLRTPDQLYIGASFTGVNSINCSMDEICIIKSARYQGADFTPPPAPYTE